MTVFHTFFLIFTSVILRLTRKSSFLVDNSRHRTNSLVLACLSEIFLPVLKEVNIEETAILCEFSSEELEQLVSYVLGGVLKTSRYQAVFEAFGIAVSTEKRCLGVPTSFGKIHIFSKNSHVQNHIIQEIHMFKIAFSVKFSFSKSHFSF